jgi:hypothetical protein
MHIFKSLRLHYSAYSVIQVNRNCLKNYYFDIEYYPVANDIIEQLIRRNKNHIYFIKIIDLIFEINPIKVKNSLRK